MTSYDSTMSGAEREEEPHERTDGDGRSIAAAEPALAHSPARTRRRWIADRPLVRFRSSAAASLDTVLWSRVGCSKRGRMRMRMWTAEGSPCADGVSWSACGSVRLPGQELGGAGTIQGTVKDPTGGVMQAVAG